MNLYLIGGLGADERVFRYLDLKATIQIIEWIEPTPKEELKSYVKRLSSQINQEEKFGILGVSFGGIVAVELSKILQPTKVILISSVETHDQLSSLYLKIGRTKILNLIPSALLKPPKAIMGFLFGAENKTLLNEIIKDTSPDFIRWALNSIIQWRNHTNKLEILRIHGTKDRLIPLKGSAIKIKNGAHFMIVDKADQISKVVNDHF